MMLTEITSGQDLGQTTTYSFNRTVSFRVFPVTAAKSEQSSHYFSLTFLSLKEEDDLQDTNTISYLPSLSSPWKVQGPSAFDYPIGPNTTETGGSTQQALILLNDIPNTKDGLINVTSYYFPKRVALVGGNETLYLLSDSLFVSFVLKNWPFRSRTRLNLTVAVDTWLQEDATVVDSFFGTYPGKELLLPLPNGGIGHIFFPVACTEKDSQRPAATKNTIITTQQQPGRTLVTISFPTFTEFVSYSTLYSVQYSSATSLSPFTSLSPLLSAATSFFPFLSAVFLSFLFVLLSA